VEFMYIKLCGHEGIFLNIAGVPVLFFERIISISFSLSNSPCSQVKYCPLIHLL